MLPGGAADAGDPHGIEVDGQPDPVGGVLVLRGVVVLHALPDVVVGPGLEFLLDGIECEVDPLAVAVVGGLSFVVSSSFTPSRTWL
jgi:hypothetical protein